MSRALKNYKKDDYQTFRGTLVKERHQKLLKEREDIIVWLRSIFSQTDLSNDEFFSASGIYLCQLLNILRPTEMIRYVLTNFTITQTTENLNSYHEAIVNEFGFEKSGLFEVTEFFNDPTLPKTQLVPTLNYLKDWFYTKGIEKNSDTKFRKVFVTKKDLDPKGKLYLKLQQLIKKKKTNLEDSENINLTIEIENQFFKDPSGSDFDTNSKSELSEPSSFSFQNSQSNENSEDSEKSDKSEKSGKGISFLDEIDQKNKEKRDSKKSPSESGQKLKDSSSSSSGFNSDSDSDSDLNFSDQSEQDKAKSNQNLKASQVVNDYKLDSGHESEKKSEFEKEKKSGSESESDNTDKKGNDSSSGSGFSNESKSESEGNNDKDNENKKTKETATTEMEKADLVEKSLPKENSRSDSNITSSESKSEKESGSGNENKSRSDVESENEKDNKNKSNGSSSGSGFSHKSKSESENDNKNKSSDSSYFSIENKSENENKGESESNKIGSDSESENESNNDKGQEKNAIKETTTIEMETEMETEMKNVKLEEKSLPKENSRSDSNITSSESKSEKESGSGSGSENENENKSESEIDVESESENEKDNMNKSVGFSSDSSNESKDGHENPNKNKSTSRSESESESDNNNKDSNDSSSSSEFSSEFSCGFSSESNRGNEKIYSENESENENEIVSSDELQLLEILKNLKKEKKRYQKEHNELKIQLNTLNLQIKNEQKYDTKEKPNHNPLVEIENENSSSYFSSELPTELSEKKFLKKGTVKRGKGKGQDNDNKSLATSAISSSVSLGIVRSTGRQTFRKGPMMGSGVLLAKCYPLFQKYIELQYEEIYPKTENKKFLQLENVKTRIEEMYQYDRGLLECFFLINTFKEWPTIPKNTISPEKLFKKNKDKIFRSQMKKHITALSRRFERVRQQNEMWLRMGRCYHDVRIDNSGCGLFRNGKIWFEKKLLRITINGIGIVLELKWKDNIRILLDTQKKLNFMLIDNGNPNQVIIHALNPHSRRVIVFLLMKYFQSKGKNKLIGKNDENINFNMMNIKPSNNKSNLFDLSVMPPLYSPKSSEKKYFINNQNMFKKRFFNKKLNRFQIQPLVANKVIFVVHIPVKKKVPFEPGFIIIEKTGFKIRIKYKKFIKFSSKFPYKFSIHPKQKRAIEITSSSTKLDKYTIVALNTHQAQLILKFISYFRNLY
ncbi:hypothetical protein M0812_00865 [Anaeramoeba flamelloides]|uniref:Calponin-homology (CH) domain-containing protein n=1 Tax=Anaeramoeba flamelloides TaxID=1746091 RepID=A0AAV8A4P4_9EUKA|nr:hypothetical protein M0812_00865 [Anaeramoeba flamelloides]